MTTSSSERGRCTRISPSAVLDDRLESKDLEWALDHLKSCDVCRDRVEVFREIVVRVDRLPIASIPPSVLRDAYTWAIPEGLRTDPDLALGPMEGTLVTAEPRPEPTRFELPRWEASTREAPAALGRPAIADQPSPPPPPPPPLPTQSLFPLEDAISTPVHEVALDSHREEARPIGEETKAEESPPLEPDARRHRPPGGRGGVGPRLPDPAGHRRSSFHPPGLRHERARPTGHDRHPARRPAPGRHLQRHDRSRYPRGRPPHGAARRSRTRRPARQRPGVYGRPGPRRAGQGLHPDRTTAPGPGPVLGRVHRAKEGSGLLI